MIIKGKFETQHIGGTLEQKWKYFPKWLMLVLAKQIFQANHENSYHIEARTTEAKTGIGTKLLPYYKYNLKSPIVLVCKYFRSERTNERPSFFPVLKKAHASRYSIYTKIQVAAHCIFWLCLSGEHVRNQQVTVPTTWHWIFIIPTYLYCSENIFVCKHGNWLNSAHKTHYGNNSPTYLPTG